MLVLIFACFAFAQDQDAKEKAAGKDNDKDKKSEVGGNFVKVEGKLRCDKPEPAYAIDVPDRNGHALMLTKRKCTWTEPLVISGGKTRDGVAVTFTEKMEGKLHVHGFEVDDLDNGEKLTWQSMGQVLAEKGPADAKGRWSLMRGTGKFKGAKGGGTYEGKLGADDVLTLEFDGVYDPTAMVGDKK